MRLRFRDAGRRTATALIVAVGLISGDTLAANSALASSSGSSGHSKGGEAEKPEKPRAPRVDARFVEIQSLLVQTRDGRGNWRTVVFDLTLELEGGRSERSRVERYLPRLRDAYLQTLSPPPRAEGRVDLSAAKEVLLKISADVLGPDVVRDILIRQVLDTNAG